MQLSIDKKILPIKLISVRIKIEKYFSGCGAVGSAPALGAGGRTFKSCHPDHSKPTAHY